MAVCQWEGGTRQGERTTLGMLTYACRALYVNGALNPHPFYAHSALMSIFCRY